MERELYHVLTIFKYKFLALSEGIILEVIKKYHNESRVSDRIYIRCLYKQRDKQRSTKHYTNLTKTGLDMYEYICITERL
jgi:hypothetical protein